MPWCPIFSDGPGGNSHDLARVRIDGDAATCYGQLALDHEVVPGVRKLHEKSWGGGSKASVAK
jgi:hypothetical protein